MPLDPAEVQEILRGIQAKLTDQCILIARMDERLKAMERRAAGYGGLAGAIGGLIGGAFAAWAAYKSGNP